MFSSILDTRSLAHHTSAEAEQYMYVYTESVYDDDVCEYSTVNTQHTQTRTFLGMVLLR
jgi:hypothetical protein